MTGLTKSQVGFKFETGYFSLKGIFSWETASRRQGHMKLSQIGKFPIKYIGLFDITFLIIVNSMNDLMSQLVSSQKWKFCL